MMAVANHYKVLGVDRKSTSDQIKKAYHRLAREFHPDKNKQPGAEEKFKSIGASYAILSDSEKRRVYDLQQPVDSVSKPPPQPDRGRGREQPREQPKPTTRPSSSTGWARFRKSSGSRAYTDPPSFDRFRFRSTDFDEFFAKPTTSEGKATASGGRSTSRQKSGRTGFTSPLFDFGHVPKGFGRPEWNNDFSESIFAEMEKDFAFGDILGNNFRKFMRAPPQDVFGNEDEYENWFDLKLHPNPNPVRDKGRSGLDDMWDWSVPMFKKKKAFGDISGARMSGGEDFSHVQLPCIYCGRVMNPANLASHEEICGRFHTTPRTGSQTARDPQFSSSDHGWQSTRTANPPKPYRTKVRL